MLERREELVPVTASAIAKGKTVEYDASEDAYKECATAANACGVLLEAVEASQDPAYALVGFAGEYEDSEVTFPVSEADEKAALRKCGIFVTERTDA